MKSVRKAVLALIIANMIWGAAAPIFKLSLTNIPPFTLAFWRFFLGALILLTVFGPHVAKPGELLKKDGKSLLLYALSGITVNIIFFFEGLKHTLSINAPIIASGAPIVTMLLAIIFLNEPFVRKKFIGMIAGSIGIIIIIIEPILEKGIDGSVLGNIFLAVATLGAVGQTLIGRKVLQKYNPTLFTFWAFLIGSLTFLPLAIFEVIQTPLLYQQINTYGYIGIAYGALFSSVLGYGLFAWGLSKIQATDATMFTYIDPIIGTILGFILLNERISPMFLLGAVLIFSGIFIAEGRLHYHPFRRLL